jgi:predicted dehydrogenase
MTKQKSENQTLRIIQFGVDHPHAEMYRQTILANPHLILVGAVDSNPDHARAQLTRESIDIPVSTSLTNLLATTDADAALITLPNDRTPAAAIDAANAGLHLFIEKPGARTAAEFLPVIEAIERNNVRFSMGYLRRFSPLATQLRKFVQDESVGNLVSAQITFSTLSVAQRNAAYQRGSRPELLLSGEDAGSENADAPVHWMFDREQAGGGILHWLGVHWIDLLRFVSGDNIAHVTARLSIHTEVPIDVEDTASLILETTNGAQLTLTSAYVLDKGPDQIAIGFQGTRGWMTWPRSGEEIVVHSSDPSWADEPTRTIRIPSIPMPGYSGQLGYETLDTFRRAALFGDPMPITPQDALAVLQVLDTARISSNQEIRSSIPGDDRS